MSVNPRGPTEADKMAGKVEKWGGGKPKWGRKAAERLSLWCGHAPGTIPSVGSLTPGFSPWTLASKITGTGLRKPIAEWEVYGGAKRFKSPLLTHTS